MAFCKYCGKELDKNGNCSCADFKASGGEKKERIKADGFSDNKTKNVFIIIGIVAVILLIGVLAGYIYFSVNAYKKPINTMVKGINHGSTEKIVSAMYTDSAAAELKVRAKDKGMSWEEYLKQNDKTIDTIRKSKNIKKVKCKIIAKEKLSGSNLSDVEKYYLDGYGEDVKKAYRVEVEFTVKYKDNEDTQSGWLTVAKVKDNGWRYCNSQSDQFEFIKDLITLL